MRSVKYLAAAAASAIALSFCLTPLQGALASSPSTGPAPVVVTNTSANPVPVAGAVQAVQSGPWSVGVSNFPSTQVVTGTVGVSNFPSSFKVDPSGNTVTDSAATTSLGLQDVAVAEGSVSDTTKVDVSGAKEVRVGGTCITQTGGGDCSQVLVNVFVCLTQCNFLIDSIQLSGLQQQFLRVYDTPGLQMFFDVHNSSSGPVHFIGDIVGRAN